MSYAEWIKKKKEGENPQTADSTTPNATQETISGSSESGKAGSYGDWIRKKRETSTVQGWTESAKSLLNDTQKYFTTWRKRDDADEEYAAIRDRRTNLLAQADTWRKMYAGNDEAIKHIDSVVSYLADVGQMASDAFEHYSQWDTNDAYQKALRESGYYDKYQGKSYTDILATLEQMEDGEEKDWLSDYSYAVDYNEKLGYDLGAADSEISAMEDFHAKSFATETWYNSYRMNPNAWSEEDINTQMAVYNELKEKYGSVAELEALIDEKKKYRDEAAKIQNAYKLGSVSDPDSEYYDPEFKKYAAEGAAIKNPSVDDAEGGLYLFGWRPFGEDVGNIVTYSRENAHAIAYGETQSTDMVGDVKYAEMDEDEVSVYNYYLAKYGKKEAQKYLDTLDLDGRKEKKIAEYWQSFTKAHPFWGSVFSVGTSLASGVEFLYDGARYITGIDDEMDTNLEAMKTNVIRGTVSEMVDWKIGNWDAFDFLYNTTMSGIDSAAALAFGNYGGTVLGLSAAAQGVNDGLARGMSSSQAFWNGVFSGVFEGLFETYSIGRFNALKEVAPEGVKAIIKNLGKSMLTNATEEMLTEFANITYDTLINGEFANYTWDELMNGAWKQAAGQIIEAGASGALMGFGFGVIGNVAGYYSGKSEKAEALYGSDPGALVSESLEINPDNSFARKMQARLDDGKTISGGQMNRMMNQNEKALRKQDVQSIQSATEARLTELGETGDVTAIAAALAKKVAGKSLSRSEQKLIAESKYGQRVANELDTDNINSGDYSSTWAQKIDTQRINAAEYSRLVEAAQLPQETAETAGEQVNAEAKNEVKAAQVEPVEPVTANDEQMTGKLADDVPVQFNEAPKVAENAEPETKQVTLEDASKKYGAQAQAMIRTYSEGQDVAKFDAAYQVAYDMGKSGVAASYAMESDSTSYLTEEQRQLAYNTGRDAAKVEAEAKDAENKKGANGKQGRKKGTVRGDGVTVKDLDEAFNLTQSKAYNYLTSVAEATGIDIVLYLSKPNAEGNYEDAQGKYDRSEPGTLYIDLNAGLRDIKDEKDVHRYFMLRTFAHEFTHFIEKWNPIQYNEFRKLVFDTMTERGENVHDLIEDIQRQNPGMSYDKASREVLAEGMVDILPDSHFVQDLAENHKGIFRKLLDMLKDFLANIRAYYNTIGGSYYRGAIALKEQVGDTVKYLDGIVKMWDQIAVQAVENYQKTVATEEITQEVLDNGTGEEISHRGNAESSGRVGKENAGGEGSPRERCERRIKEILRKKAVEKHEKSASGRGRRELREKREDFEARSRKDGLMYVEANNTAMAFRVAPEAIWNENAKVAAEKLAQYGLDVVVFTGEMQFNRKDVTETSVDGSTVRSGGKLTVFISAELAIDGMETAYHEAFHAAGHGLFAKYHEKIADVVASNIDVGSESFTRFVSTIAELYAYTERNVSVSKFEAEIIEEFYAWYVGKSYDTKGGDMQVDMAQFSDMEAVKTQLDSVYAQMEAHKDKAFQGLIDSNVEQGTPAEAKKDAYGFTISDNVEHGSLEIAFEGKPSDAVLDVLRGNKFRWHRTKKIWYGYGERQAITDALHAAYEAKDSASTESPAMQTLQDMGAKPVGNNALDVTDLFFPELKQNDEQSDFEKSFRNATQEERDEVVDAIQQNTKISHMAPTEIRESVDAAVNEEVNANGQNVDNPVAVQQPEPDGRGAAPVLDELQAEDVPGDGGSRDTVADTGERGQETGRDGDRPDTQRPGRGSGKGDRQSGDLRGSDGVSQEEQSARDYASLNGYGLKINSLTAKKGMTQVDIYDPAGLPTSRYVMINEAADWNKVKQEIETHKQWEKERAERLHKETTEQIAQQSTEKPKGRNFVIGDSLDLPNGEKARYKANIEAIRLVKKLEAEGRHATEAEQVILSKYVGWGGLANAFDQKKADWSKEFNELKELLTDEEYTSARGSTLNAHYTDISVIKAMYDGLKQLGFAGGRMLEPSSGVGNFVGAMPADMASQVRSWTMVELDGITGLIAKHLYPNADVRIQGFEKANIPNNFMDVAISNVPFGNYAIADKAYPKKVTSAIHNYFFAKTLDKVRPGGIVMFITSSFTMNAKETAVRQYIMQRADLLGAIRLPDSAFKGNAGTEVVTDILVLKKREANTPYAGENFLEAPYQYIDGFYGGAFVNKYFQDHPEMVLGKAAMTGGMYRGDNLTYKALEGKGTLADQIREAFKNIQGKMDYPAQLSPEKANFAVEKAGKKTKENGLVVKDGKVYRNTNGELIEQNVAKGVADRIAGMLEIRDAAKDLQAKLQQGLNDTEIRKARTKLNKAYDDFVKKHGYINSQANKNAINNDPDRYSILALENWNPETKKATKADIFAKNTIAANRTVTSAKDVAEGLIVSVNQTGGVDAALIAKLTGKTEADVTRELVDSRQVFKNRDGQLETAEVYLSGNVRAKLRDAEAMVPLDADYQKNVEALKSVMPEDVGYQDIFVNPGTPWIPDSVYSDFVAYMLGSRNTEWSQAVDVTRNKDTGNFTVELKNRYLKTNFNNTQKWGTKRRSFLDLIEAMLNSKSVVVKDKLADGSYIINKDETAAANEKIENIQKEFQEWLWQDEARRTELATLYNETFNSIVTPKYNGDNLTVNGANAMKPLRPHQRNAVQRIISSGGNTLLAHKVGAGKTYEMAAAAMKLKQLGLVKKPMFAVPKPLVAQWGNEFMDFFPTAKLLVAEASDFTAANRKVFMNRIANGDYDAVIVSYEQFERLPVSNDFTRELYQEQINSVIAAIEEAKADKGGKALSVKDLEKKRKSLQTKIDKLSDTAKDEDNIDFEQLGVDSIFVDEAHNFKNLFYTTSMSNVAGLSNKDGAKRSFDLYTKVRYLQKLNGGRGIVFATATPVMNSMSEMYIMQKYLQPDLLDQLGLTTFDAWAKQFGEVVNGVEIKPSGQGYRVKQSFSRFKNMSELQLLFRNFADVLTDIPGLKIPKMKGGRVNVVVCEPGQFQQDYMKELEKRADNIKNVDPSVDNMLKITSDGRKISYTQRMIDPTLPYEEGCKIYRCADNVLQLYQESKDIKGTQLIFCDMATPKGKSKVVDNQTEDIETDMESAQLYEDLKARLVKGGIPAKQIAFIHEADTDVKKKKLFADVNDGTVRVLIGSTGKMGVGMNAQKRVVAIHHLDAPWRPGDVEQRNGRAFRQGNINDEVENFTYVTEGSFDARLWDILDRKQSFINQVMNGESVGRDAEDTGEVTLSAAEVKALASGSPLIMEQVQLDTDIKKLESLYRAHRSAISNAKSRLAQDKGMVATLENYIANGEADLAARVDTYSEKKFSITVGKQKFTEKKDAGAALMAEATAKAKEEGYTTIGKFAGFDLRVIKTHEGIKGLISGRQGYGFNTYPNNTTFMINHLVATVEGLDGKVQQWQQQLSETRKDIAEQEKLITQPFAKQAELDQKRARYNEVMDILNPKEEQSMDGVDEEDVQEQSRAYLDHDVQNQQRTDSLTDREVLLKASEEVTTVGWTDAEKDALDIFQQRLSKLEALQVERAEQGRLYREQQFGAKVDREAAAKTLNRMKILDGQIEDANIEVLDIESKKVLKQVLQKARTVVETEERQRGDAKLKRWRDRRNNAAAIKKYRERLQKDVGDLTNWVLHPNNKDIVKHIPDALKSAVIPFLSSIDFTSKKQLSGGNATKADQEFVKRLNGLKAALKPHQNLGDMYEGYTDLPPNFMEKLQAFIDTTLELVNSNTGEFVVNQMTADELRDLSHVVTTLKEFIKNFNKFHANAMFQHVHEAGNNTISELEQMNDAGDRTGTLSNFVLWQQMRPAYAFERFGEGGKAIYDGLRRGQAKLAFNTKVIVEFSKKAYTESEVKRWEDQINEINLSGEIIKMPVSTIMSFYELSKRPQALGHILGQGVRVATFKRGNKKISDVGHKLTMEDVQTIIGTLTERQKEVADNLQKFMQEQGGKWGNYVSLKRFGEELFGEDHYFPINSDGRHLQANADESPSAASLYALLNMGFTKSITEGANNRLVLYSIFDVFANHMASMAQYNAMALPVVDALKWFNFQQKSEPDEDGKRFIVGSVRDQMDRVYGVPEENKPGSGRQGYAQSFVINILKAFNGTEAQGTPTDSWFMKQLHRYNVAQIAYNFRVVVQQPLAITRAANLIDYGSIMKGMKLSPAAIKKNIQEMRQYSGIAAWKALGFYDVNISRGLTDLIKHSSTTIDKINEFGMKGAEAMDTWAWASMWGACKEEVIKKQRLTPNSDGFYDAVTELFEEVIYKTQVVDSILTKNEYLRSKGLGARLTGSFMSEPTTSASMLVSAYDNYKRDIQKGMSKAQAWKKNSKSIVRTAYVFGMGALILAAVQAVSDAFRDDDDYEDWYEKWLEAFGGNLVDELMPINKLPIFSDFYDLAKELLSATGLVDTYGNPPQSMFMQWWDSLVKGTQIISGRITGEEDRYTWYGGAYKLLQAISGMTGLPLGTATREIATAWNSTVGSMAPSMKIKDYDAGDKNKIKYAYQDGYLTDEEAMEALLEQGVVDNENEAYFMIQGWEAGTGYSRYDEIFDTVRNGGDITEAMKELTSHGYKAADVLSQVKSEIGSWYKEGKITKQQATDMLTKYMDMDRADITALVNKWSSKVVTGIAFEDIKDEYLNGNITAQRAIEMYVRYGGYTQEKATDTVTKWRAEKETGHAYDDLQELFVGGKISSNEAILTMQQYGGVSKADAESTVQKWQCEKDTGYAYADLQKLYVAGKITAEKAAELRVKYGGATSDDARKTVLKWQCEKDNGVKYDDIDSAYLSGQITEATAISWLVKYGERDQGDAELAVQAYAWKAQNPEYKDLSDAAIDDYITYCDPSGIQISVFYEAKKYTSKIQGDGTSGSVKRQYVQYILSLNLTFAQQNAMWHALKNSSWTNKDTPFY